MDFCFVWKFDGDRDETKTEKINDVCCIFMNIVKVRTVFFVFCLFRFVVAVNISSKG